MKMNIALLEKKLDEAKTRKEEIAVLLIAFRVVFDRHMRKYELRHLTRLLKIYSMVEIYDAIFFSERVQHSSYPLAYTHGILKNWKVEGLLDETEESGNSPT